MELFRKTEDITREEFSTLREVYRFIRIDDPEWGTIIWAHDWREVGVIDAIIIFKNSDEKYAHFIMDCRENYLENSNVLFRVITKCISNNRKIARRLSSFDLEGKQIPHYNYFTISESDGNIVPDEESWEENPPPPVGKDYITLYIQNKERILSDLSLKRYLSSDCHQRYFFPTEVIITPQ